MRRDTFVDYGRDAGGLRGLLCPFMGSAGGKDGSGRDGLVAGQGATDANV